MKQGIHPQYNELDVVCACGEIIKTRSTLKELRLDICSKCHPYYTGSQKMMDTQGRIERSNKRYGKPTTANS